MNPDPNFIPYSNISSWGIIDVNTVFHAMKLLEENVERNLSNHGFDKDFLTVTQKIQAMKFFKTIKWTSSKLAMFELQDHYENEKRKKEKNNQGPF